MQNKIITGIAQAIGTLDSKYTVYTSNVKQDLSLPCFFIRTVNSPVNPRISNRKEITTTLSITYWPETDDEDELRSMMDATTTLYDLIEVSLGMFLRGYNQSFHISDGCLVCTIDYKTSVISQNEAESMETMLKRGKVK